jgi:hypothetical protein
MIYHSVFTPTHPGSGGSINFTPGSLVNQRSSQLLRTFKTVFNEARAYLYETSLFRLPGCSIQTGKLLDTIGLHKAKYMHQLLLNAGKMF